VPLLTRLTKLQIDELVKNHYDLGSVVSVYKIKNGWTNTLFKIVTTHGEFFLKVYEEADRMQVMAEHEVVNALVKLDFPTAGIIRNKKKEGLVDYDEKIISIFTAIDGKPLSFNPFKTVICFRIVTILNLLHKTDTNDLMYLRKLDVAELIEESLSWYLDNHRVGHFKDSIVNLYEQFSKVSFFNLTKGVIHNDLGLDNFLVVGNNVKGLIDFDQVVYGSIIDDLAKFFARSVNFNVYSIYDFTKDVARFILDYSKSGTLSQDDLHALAPLVVFHKVLILVKVKKNIKQGSLRAHIYHFEEYASLVEKEVEIMFKNYSYMESEFNRLLD